MKLITAIINTHMFEEVKTALATLDIRGLTISEVQGYGTQKGPMEVYRGATHVVEFVEKYKMEILVEESTLDQTIDTIVRSARSGKNGDGKIGDGKIWVTPVDSVIRVRTGQHGEEAIH